MKILALEREKPGSSVEDFLPHLRVEAWRAWELYQSGLLRELYFAAGQNTAVLVLECETLEAAQQALDSLPLVRAGLIDFDLIQLVPYPGFARLFAPQK
jgi:hypothetical protein